MTSRPIAALLLVLAAAPLTVTAQEAAAPPEEPAAPRLALALVDRGVVEFRALSGEKLGEAKTGAGPRALLLGTDGLFVANRGVGRKPGSTLTLIDPEGMSALRTVTVCEGCAPRGLAFDSAGRLWFTGQAHRNIYRTDPPYRDPAGSLLIAWGWPTDVARMPGTSLLVVGYREADGVAAIDTDRQFATRIDLFDWPEHVVSRPGSSEVWVASSRHGKLARIKPAGSPGRFTTELHDLGAPVGGLAATPDGTHLVASLYVVNAVVLVDPRSGEETARLELDAEPGRLAVSPGEPALAAVHIPSKKEIAIVDLQSGEAPSVTGRFAIDGSVGALLFLP